eukprot:4696746-Amphidinium_carterae.4
MAVHSAQRGLLTGPRPPRPQCDQCHQEDGESRSAAAAVGQDQRALLWPVPRALPAAAWRLQVQTLWWMDSTSPDSWRLRRPFDQSLQQHAPVLQA